MSSLELAKLYQLGKGLDVACPSHDPAYQALIHEIQSGEKGMQLNCPHCGHKAIIRSSRSCSKLSRFAFCQCGNVACGHTFKALVEIISTISPSAFPDPLVAAELKQSKRGEELYGALKPVAKGISAIGEAMT